MLLAHGLRGDEPVAEARGERPCHGFDCSGVCVAGQPRGARRRGHFVHFRMLSLYQPIAESDARRELRRSTAHLEHGARRAFRSELGALVFFKPLNLVVKLTHTLIDLLDRQSLERLADLMAEFAHSVSAVRRLRAPSKSPNV